MTIGDVAGSASGYAGTAANDDSEIFTLLRDVQLVRHSYQKNTYKNSLLSIDI